MAYIETAILECSHCTAAVAASLEHSYEARFGEHGEEEYRFSMLKCPRCSRPFLCQQEGFLDDSEADTSYWHTEWRNRLLLYPPQVAAPDASVPRPIAESYVEAHRC